MSTADPKRRRQTDTLFDGFTVLLFYYVCVNLCSLRAPSPLEDAHGL